MKTRVRSKTVHYALGQPCELPGNQLPLESEVYNFFRLQSSKMRQIGTRNTGQNAIAAKVAKDIENIWIQKANLPVQNLKTITRHVLSVVKKARTMTRKPKKRRRAEDETNPLRKLFDICACQCKSKIRTECNCPKENEVAALEWDFLWDQRQERNLGI